MEYRKMEQLSVEPSLLGFGCMRFPLLEDGKIDEAEAEKMIDKAIAEGVCYIDTAYPYHGGDSEPFVGRVLNKYDRTSYLLATKLPVWKISDVEEAKEIFESQLKRLDKDYVDFYLLHALSKERWDNLLEQGILDYCESLKAEGKIRFLGFSFHDDYEVFEEIATYRKWDFCQIQFNYMDTEIQAGMRGYKLTEKLGIPLVIMEPVKGGMLASLPEDIEQMFKEAAPDKSIASWALRYVGTLPNVKVILSGMSSYEQVLNNLDTFRNFEPLSEKELELVEKVAATIKSRVKNGCTGCKYCMPCPAGVNIPKNFSVWNTYAMYGNKEKAKKEWFVNMEESSLADKCVKCGKCEKECPQKISIREDLVRVREAMEEVR